jgi:hypothetical protein
MSHRGKSDRLESSVRKVCVFETNSRRGHRQRFWLVLQD